MKGRLESGFLFRVMVSLVIIEFSSSSFSGQVATVGSGPVYQAALAVARGFPPDIPGTTSKATSTACGIDPCMGSQA